ncbi:hypothetical protein [Sneathiella glossodoripedis]|uniref:hypothetical protein n=1 Tax=Sneathiella glossodoripedis TaxID=418853 RepID=UPI0004714750|nr:hypothetical protein [Sneathiella glossodoripedis]
MMEIRKFITGFSLAALVLLLAACAETPRAPDYAEITFRHLPSIKLNVGEIRFVREYVSPLKSPNVEHEMPVKIDSSIEEWVQQRLVAAGTPAAYAVVTLKDASVIETDLEKSTGLSALWKTDQSEKYDFRVEVEVQVVTVNGSKAFATANAVQSTTMPEDRTLLERDQMFYDKTERLLWDFNREMEKNIYSFLKPHLL